MYKIKDHIFNYIKNRDKNTFIQIGLFLIALFGIIFKGLVLQGYTLSESNFSPNLAASILNFFYSPIYYIAFTLILLSFAFLFKSKGRIIYLLILSFFISIICIFDTLYFRACITMPSVSALSQTSNLEKSTGPIFSLISPFDLLFFFDFFALIVYVVLTKKTYKQNNNRYIKVFLSTFIASLICILFIPFNFHILKNKSENQSYIYEDVEALEIAKSCSFIGYHMIDIYHEYLNNKPCKLSDNEISQINEFYNWKNENLPDNEYYGLLKNKNLLVIQVESLESFIISKEIEGQKITPTIDNLLEHSIYFPNIHEQVREGVSSDCDLMLNTSMFPIRRGCTFFKYPNTHYNSMPLILKTQGYSSTSIHSDKGVFWNYAQGLTKGIGFEHFIDQASFDTKDQIGIGLSDSSYFTQVFPMAKNLKAPFYLHTVTMTNHCPFTLPSNLKGLSLNAELDANPLGQYFQTVNYVDKQIGIFLSNLDQAGILDNTVVIITGDHTGVHKYYNHEIQKLSNKQNWFLDDGNHTVPFIIYSKDLQQTQKLDVIGGQVDLMPTLLYLFGINKNDYQNTALGRNLLNTNRNYAILSDDNIVGTNLSQEDKKQIHLSLKLSDKIVRSDYFKK